MKLITYVNFAGKCAEAFHYYEQHLGAKVVMMMTHGQNPAPSPYAAGDWKDAVLHARLTTEALNWPAPTFRKRSQCEARI